MHIVISALSLPLRAQRCHSQCCNITISTIAVTPMCTLSSQHCHYHCWPSTVILSAVTLLSAPSLSHQCTHRYPSTVITTAGPALSFSVVEHYYQHHRCHNAVEFLLHTTRIFQPRNVLKCQIKLEKNTKLIVYGLEKKPRGDENTLGNSRGREVLLFDMGFFSRLCTLEEMKKL